MLNLFKDVLPEEKQHRNYKMIASSPFHHNERKLLEEWSEGFEDRDNKFVQEFQATFNSCFWELYLYQYFKTLGFETDFTHQSPDFFVKSSISSFVAEATISSNPESFAPEYQWDFNKIPHTREEFEKILYLASIRIANSFTSKFRRYNDHYRHLDHVKDQAVIILKAARKHLKTKDQKPVVRSGTTYHYPTRCASWPVKSSHRLTITSA